MAKIEVTPELVADLLFGYSKSPVTITDCDFNPYRDALVFDIEGPDVPVSERVSGVYTVQTNRRGERFHTLEFKPA